MRKLKKFICRSCSNLRKAEKFTGVSLHPVFSLSLPEEELDLLKLAEIVLAVTDKSLISLGEWAESNLTHPNYEEAIALMEQMSNNLKSYASGGRMKR